MTKTKLTHTMELAEAQFAGWHSAKYGETLTDLCSSMGLEKEEWKIIKKEMGVFYLTDEEIKEIENYLLTYD